MSNLKIETIDAQGESCNFCNRQIAAKLKGETAYSTVLEVRRVVGSGLVVRFCDECLGDLAHWYRCSFKGEIINITGSSIEIEVMQEANKISDDDVYIAAMVGGKTLSVYTDIERRCCNTWRGTCLPHDVCKFYKFCPECGEGINT